MTRILAFLGHPPPIRTVKPSPVESRVREDAARTLYEARAVALAALNHQMKIEGLKK